MNKVMNSDQELEQLKQIIKDLKPFEVIEIKLEDNRRGRVAITRKTQKRNIIVVDD